MDFDMITDNAFKVTGGLALLALALTYLAPSFAGLLTSIMGIFIYLAFVAFGYGKDFEIAGGWHGIQAATIVGLAFLIVGVGAFGISISTALSSGIGAYTPGLGGILAIIFATAGAGLLTLAGLGAVKELV